MTRTLRSLHEAMTSGGITKAGATTQSALTRDLNLNISGGFDLPEPDWIRHLEKWRKSCPHYNEDWHGSYCERCDNAWHFPVGGAKWIQRTDWKAHPEYRSAGDHAYPEHGGKFLEPLKDSGDAIQPAGLQVRKRPTIYENRNSNELVAMCEKATIKGLPVQPFSVPEENGMNDYVRELLRMSDGGALGGRERLALPNELMDALAGDAAQEAMAKDRCLQEMRRQMTPENSGGRYVDLDTMTEAMSKGDVDSFLSHARKKIIKRSKATRRGCCLKIGGVLDQLLGPAGGEYADDKKVNDRGKADPIGESTLDENLSDDHKKLYAFRKGESRDDRAARIAHFKKHGTHLEDDQALYSFIAEEFALGEHDDDCPFRAEIFESMDEQERWVQSTIRKPGALRSHFGVQKGDALPIGEAATEYDALLSKTHLSESEEKLFGRLSLFLKVSEGMGDALRQHYRDKYSDRDYQIDKEDRENAMRKKKAADLLKKDDKETKEESMDISATANAISAFMEASHTGSVGNMKKPCYSDPHKTRDDNSEYPTALKPAKAGRNYDSGAPKSPVKGHGHRYKKGQDPIGEAAVAAPAPSPNPREAAMARKKAQKDKQQAVMRQQSMRRQGASAQQVALGQGKGPLASQWKMRQKNPAQAMAFLKKQGFLKRAGLGEHEVESGEHISETANALASFMEASHTGTVGDMKPTPYWGTTKTRDDNKKDFVKTGLDAAKGERGKGDWDPANRGESMPRYKKGADPIGGATPKQL